MEIYQFRVKNFRSIQDTDWQPFSIDNLTVLVGQNESGKSSVLDALELGYSLEPKIDSDDFRIDTELPEIYLMVDLDDDDVSSLVLTQPAPFRSQLESELNRRKRKFIVVARIVGAPGDYARLVEVPKDVGQTLFPLLATNDHQEDGASEATADDEDDQEEVSNSKEKTDYKEDFLEELWRCIPEFILFREASSILPNRIDIIKGVLAEVPGKRGASNFISAAELDLASALSGDHRKRDAALNRASSKITRELQEFWSQLLGKSDRISLICELKHHPASEAGKAGLPYLAFWVKEGDQPLYPSQRSRGTRWFISFFLELFAGNKKYPGRVFLLDEPATFLHPAAQQDVVKLLEKLASETKIIYSTHSPYMLDHSRLHRVLAVERDSFDEDTFETNTVVRRGFDLATASRLTLAPILSLIGVSLNQQQIIKNKNNVLIEEISALYYINAFVRLLGKEADYQLVACSGVDNVKVMVDLFLAWGIKFTVVVDGDGHGKKLLREIKAKYFLEDSLAKEILQLIEDCDGIEDVFSRNDFIKHILLSEQSFDGKNSTHVKKMGSKPMLALRFWQSVDSGKIGQQDLESETIAKIQEIVQKMFSSFRLH